VNSDKTVPANVTYLRCCPACGAMHIRSGETCSRDCLMIWAEFNDFTTLRGILTNARWAGAQTEAEMLKEYFRKRMCYGVRRLVHSEDALAAVLIEIVAEMEETEAVGAVL
jgi:hypothetical protein